MFDDEEQYSIRPIGRAVPAAEGPSGPKAECLAYMRPRSPREEA